MIGIFLRHLAVDVLQQIFHRLVQVRVDRLQSSGGKQRRNGLSNVPPAVRFVPHEERLLKVFHEHRRIISAVEIAEVFDEQFANQLRLADVDLLVGRERKLSPDRAVFVQTFQVSVVHRIAQVHQEIV